MSHSRRASPGDHRSDQPFTQGVRDRVRPVPQLEPVRHVVQDALHRALRIAQLVGDLLRRKPGRDKPEHFGFPVAHAAQVQPARLEHLALQAGNPVQQPSRAG